MWSKYFIATGDISRLGELTPFIERIILSDGEIDIMEAIFEMLAKVFHVHPLDRDTAIRYFDCFIGAGDPGTQLSDSSRLA
jgi:hypothetical protein